MMIRTLISSLALGAAVATTGLAQTGNPFAVAVKVNDQIVTNYEIAQRAALLQAFGQRGDLLAQARDQLVDERLRLEAASRAGLEVNAEEISAGIDEFAARANLTGEQLLQYIGQRRVAPETMQDFVRTGLLWRNVVQSRFAGRVNVSDAEIDRNLSLQSASSPESILISEIQIPLGQSDEAAIMELMEELSQSITSEAAFSAAARRHSRASSRGRGGRVNWLPVSALPPALAGQIMALEPGEVTAPVRLSGTVALFQLRGIRQDAGASDTGGGLVNFTTVTIPADRGQRAAEDARKLMRDVDTCADLRAESERFGGPNFEDHAANVSTLSPQVALELAKLDRNESGSYTAPNGQITVVMVCDRVQELPEGARDELRQALFNRRLTNFGEGFLAEIKSDATVVYR